MFNKKQLIVIWITVMILSIFIYRASVISMNQYHLMTRLTKRPDANHTWKPHLRYDSKGRRSIIHVNWLELSLIPALLGGATIITLYRRR